MGVPPLTDDELAKVMFTLKEADGNMAAAAKIMGIPRATLQNRVKVAERRGVVAREPFEAEPIPSELQDIDQIIERRKKQFEIKDRAKIARRLIQVKVKIDGPIGITHLGDPHVDDDGTDIHAIEKHIRIINDTKGFFGGNVGDQQNNWIGRLAALYGQQATSQQEAWALTEWMVTSVQWIYILGGNHDVWSGAGDPLKWMLKNQQGVFENWGARLNLLFPTGKQIRINARHDFPGHSQWNSVHGVSKAAQMGWRDHILTAGHKHTSGYQVLKCPSTGLISHALRVAGFKKWDRYAEQLNLPDQNISPSFSTIIDPQYADDDPRLITTIFDVEEAADFLTWKRSRK